uniref:Tc1-like transposase DDE domain-containing protein n=1 Tax=Mycena chlorophos TaxID=658473 RepID=A0ABQ0LBY6_MYCCL|nr:predicted protein [Mycena chlorophos]
MGRQSDAKKRRAAIMRETRQSISAGVKRTIEAVLSSPTKLLKKVTTPRKKRRNGKENQMELDASDEDDMSLINPSSDASNASILADDPFLHHSFQLDTPQLLPTGAATGFTMEFTLPPPPNCQSIDEDQVSIHTISPRPAPRFPNQPMHPDEMDDPRDSEPVPEHEDELLATNSERLHSDDYQRPRAPPDVLRGARHVDPTRPSRFAAPHPVEATKALVDIKTLLRGPSRHALFTGNGVGFKDPGIDAFTRNRLEGMRAALEFYTNTESKTKGRWGDSALMAAIGLGRGKHCARLLAKLCRNYIEDRQLLPFNPFGEWNKTMLSDEDLANDVRLHLQSLGKDITAKKLTEYLRDPSVRERHGIEHDVSERTCQRSLHTLGYRFHEAKKGMYVDGHERADVVHYRNTHYLPRLQELQRRAYAYADGQECEGAFPVPGRRVILWYHDESIFYAHDRRRKTWYHKDAPSVPYKKGDGASYMVADYFSADFGWLRNPITGETARACIRPGKNRDGYLQYFTAAEVCEQAEKAMRIVQQMWPEFDHVFIYDNATTHKKRPDGSLSARAMPKFPSGSRAKSDANFLVEVNRRDAAGNLMYDTTTRALLKDKIPMTGATFADGRPQELYFPTDHPDHPGKFKGMKLILEERGFTGLDKRLTECPGFKCVDLDPDAPACCCRRLLFNQPDFFTVKSILEETCAARGVEVLFLPKFHCELNPIEMVWGYAKWLYRLKPESSKEEHLEATTLDSLSHVPLQFMRKQVSSSSLQFITDLRCRYVNRAHRFGDGYLRGLSGRQAAWAAKKYHGHRVFPANILEELDQAGVL